MKCFHCKQEIKPGESYTVTAPDGDYFHPQCVAKYEKEKEKFFNETIHDDDKFFNWLGLYKEQYF